MKPYSGRPLFWVCMLFIFGIIINKYFDIPFEVLFSLAAVCLVLTIFIRHLKVVTIFLLLAVFCAGSMYARNYETVYSNHISKIFYGYGSNTVLVEGMVVSDVEPRAFFKGKKTVFSLEVKRLKSQWGWKDYRGIILVNLFREQDIRYGDVISIEGKIHRPFNYAKDSSFSYREYLGRRGIMFILSVKKIGRVQVLERNQGRFIKTMSLRLKHRLSEVLEKHLPQQAAGLMQAFLLGDRYNIPKSVNDLFKVSGVAHIIAISGFNIGIVTYVIVIILKMFPIPRVAQYVLTMALLIVYAVMTGGQPPVVRATIMAVVFLASFLIERKQESINTLAAAALILLLMNPLNLFDVGFQLSFISVLFIICLYPQFMRLFYRIFPGLNEESEGYDNSGKKGGLSIIKLKIIRLLLQSAGLSLAAYMGVVPLVVYYFKLITPVVIIANVVVVPLASLIIFLGMGLLAAGIVLPFVAFAFANCLIALLNLMIVCVFLFAQMPGAYFQIKSFPLWGVLLYYGLIIVVESFYHLWFKKTLEEPSRFLNFD